MVAGDCGSRWGFLDSDARLACIACHDPHQPLVHDPVLYDEKCLACHVVTPTKKAMLGHPGKACPVRKKDCVTCHMPRVVLPNMHAPFTDNLIRIVRPGAPSPDYSDSGFIESLGKSGTQAFTYSGIRP